MRNFGPHVSPITKRRCDNKAEKPGGTRPGRTLRWSHLWLQRQRVAPAFQTMAVLVWLMWLTLFSDTVAGPVQTWSGEVDSVPTEEHGAARPSFYLLPMFHHAPAPLIAPELFLPAPDKRPLPDGLAALLLPPTARQRGAQEFGARAVEARCGAEKISVRVDRFQLRFWAAPSLFRLGSCQVNRISPRFLYFHYGLTECDGESTVGSPTPKHSIGVFTSALFAFFCMQVAAWYHICSNYFFSEDNL